jgi:helicase-like protein/SNF2 domain-containing protein/N-6 DNA methylase
MNWRSNLEGLTSLGAAHEGVTCLADLAQARSEHLGQFFTPLAVVRCMWAVVEQSCAHLKEKSITVLDNSVGSGRLMHFAQPDRHRLYGMDIHAESMQLLQWEAQAAGFTCEFVRCAMEDARPTGFDVALINPPFSLNLQSPNMQSYACTRWGKFGPNSGATSHEYALAQALDAASLVVALLPTSTASEILSRPAELLGDNAARFRAVFDLGSRAFLEEGANVATSIVVFGPAKQAVLPLRQDIPNLTEWKTPDLDVAIEPTRWEAKLRTTLPDTELPNITMPVTGDTQVRVVHSGRKIHLLFRCGFLQARCLNAVYRRRVHSTVDHRLPAGVQFAGEGLLDVENIVAAEDPAAEWRRLLDKLACEGAQVQVDPGLTNYLKRRIRQAKRETTPFGHWIWREEHADSTKAKAKVPVPLDPKSWVSPLIKQGDTVTLKRVTGEWLLQAGKHSRTFTTDEARRLFDFGECEAGWHELHPALQTVFPQIAASLRATAIRRGIDKWLNWEYQFEDLVELCIRPKGAICAWKQGLGKARLAAALPLLLGVRKSLIAMPAFLLDEFPDRLEAAGIEGGLWQVIRGPREIKNLRRINVISYERLRMEMPGVRRTYAAALRRRVPLVVCDEGEVLANPTSDQSREIAQLAARRLFILAGTPIPNYPRDLLNVATAAIGDGVQAQPYGLRHPMLTPANVKSMEFSMRGRTQFADNFVTLEWVTHEFAETLSEGAKREVPKIAKLGGYRQWLAPFIKRRLPDEPQVAKHVKIPKPDHEEHDIEWDLEHLAHYLRVADEFAWWWKDRHKDRKGGNLIALLARIDAVVQAGNAPQLSSEKGSPSRYSGGPTSKQRWVIARAVELARTQKVVVYARSPKLLDLFQRELATCGVDSIVYHGERNTAQRRKDLQRFRHCKDTNVALASYGVTRAGLDLYQAQNVILASRSWSDREEDQAIRRLLRPQQQRHVVVDKPHLRGGIDVYQGQLCAWKASAASAGLDWGAPLGDDVEFMHLDQILGKFVEALAAMHNMDSYEFRKLTKETA